MDVLRLSSLTYVTKTSLYFSPPQGIEHLSLPQLLFLTMRKNLFSALTISSLAIFEPHRPDSNFFGGLSNRRHICVTNECNFAAISLLLPAKITKVLAANSEAASHFSLLTHSYTNFYGSLTWPSWTPNFEAIWAR